MSAQPPTLAIDLGGTKIAAARMDGPVLLERRQAATPHEGSAQAWMDAIASLAAGWDDVEAAGVAVTGVVRDGAWTALNPETLPVPAGFALVQVLFDRLGVPVLACNDAQAAAWGEFRYGAGQGEDMIFLTVSTGIGGGLVLQGRLVGGRGGFGGHVGITPVDTRDGVRMLEQLASGTALRRLGGAGSDPVRIAAAALAGEPSAERLMDAVVAPLALAIRRLHLEVAPAVFIIGGGLGLAPGYLDRLGRHLDEAPPLLRPTIRAAALGADAGLIGVADLARNHNSARG